MTPHLQGRTNYLVVQARTSSRVFIYFGRLAVEAGTVQRVLFSVLPPTLLYPTFLVVIYLDWD